MNTAQVRIWRSSGQGQGHRSKKSPKYVFPQCKTSTCHNSYSGCIKHRAMRFACSLRFSAMADRMVWPPSQSCDRKKPRVTKYTHSWLVGLKLVGNLFVLRYCVTEQKATYNTNMLLCYWAKSKLCWVVFLLSVCLSVCRSVCVFSQFYKPCLNW